jgi:phosphoribosylpyrophosphate synthetase
MKICSVAPLLATAIERNHYDKSLADLRAFT